MSNEIKEVNESIQAIKPTVENMRTYLKVPQGKTDNELALDLELARQRGLNPFTGEMYYAQDGRLALTKAGESVIAARHPNFAPPIAGIVVVTNEGEILNRTGTIKLPTDTIIGAWARIDSKNYETAVSFAEYYSGAFGMDSDGNWLLDKEGNRKRKTKSNGNAMGQTVWDTKPATMIRKVAIVQALREAYPQAYSGLYDESEQEFTETSDKSVQEHVQQAKPLKEAPKQVVEVDEF